MVDMLIVSKVYYWNARLNRKTAILAGPFYTAKEAEETADIVSPRFLQEEPAARNATFGVVEMNAPGCGAGRYNELLPAKLQGRLLLDTGHRQ